MVKWCSAIKCQNGKKTNPGEKRSIPFQMNICIFVLYFMFFFVSMKIKTTHNVQFSMPFAAEIDIKSSGSS